MQIGIYTAKNIPTKAFLEAASMQVPESSARRLKSEYISKRSEKSCCRAASCKVISFSNGTAKLENHQYQIKLTFWAIFLNFPAI